ncbi:hypothetical protein V6N11_083851 [Hibiscus sabdariffa]|uniref:RNase H type-1 domain-containing protein n=1 Tax=Hibiscus sabdariffa TaxID=183260 RepID=A0ABR2QD68_9ROSI
MRYFFVLQQSKFRSIHRCGISHNGHLQLMANLKRNEHVFEPKRVRWEPILSHGKRLQQECRAAAALLRHLGNKPVLPREHLRWKRPPVDWCKLNTDGVVRRGSGLALFVDIRKLVVEVDSLDAIRVIRQALEGQSSPTLVFYIIELLNRSWSVKLQHVPREANRLADGMAKLASTEDFMCRHFLSPLDSVLRLVQLDCLD